MFGQPSRRTAWGEGPSIGDDGDTDPSPSPPSRPESSLSSASRGAPGRRAATQGWQITRKHAHLPREELARMMTPEGTEGITEHSDVEVGAG